MPPAPHPPEDHSGVLLPDFEPASPALPHHPAAQAATSLSTNRSHNFLHHNPFGYPSPHSASGFLASSDRMDPDLDSLPDSVSVGGYSPPAWRRLGNGDRSSGFWRKSDNILGHHRQSEERSMYDSDDDLDAIAGLDDEILAQAIRTRLPAGSISPEKERSPEPETNDNTVRIDQRLRENAQLPPVLLEKIKQPQVHAKDVSENYIRFAVRAEVQQRTEPIEAAVNFLRRRLSFMTRSWQHLLTTLLAIGLATTCTRTLFFEPPPQPPVPDLVKVAGIARSFEPLIYFSENGVSQVGDLQATGLAVWDLGESVRTSNMTSAPLIVRELDDLSDSLKTLSVELTRFFANVDGDIDAILQVMDWARRELAVVRALPSPPLTTAYDNIHTLLSRAGVLADRATGDPTPLGALATTVFGAPTPQRTRAVLEKTFYEFLSVLEDAVAAELLHSLHLFALFEAVDNRFHNLHRLVARETSAQDDSRAEVLAGLWARLLGPNPISVAKYDRNRALLLRVRERTVRNKGVLAEHNTRLLALRAALESLRRRIVSPLVRSVNGSTLSVDDQIRGIEDVGMYLDGVRARQKGKLMEALYGSGSGRGGHGVGGGDSRRMIDDTASAGAAGRSRFAMPVR